MGQALYRKYRSKKLSEVVGQKHITDTLTKALKQGRISHAYLFTGPRGVGKTSVARILAHEINKLPYTDDSQNIDIIEIDAASNRRIDEIRELRDKVYIAPSECKFKIYIIDEVHMLTTPAFNALLKTLEEPPEHVIFILATTDSHKLPETIISRTQRFNFKPIDKFDAIKHLRYIANQEKINISDDALALISEHAEGSFRDSISILDQASSIASKIDEQNIQDLLGIPPLSSIETLVAEIHSGSASSLMTSLKSLYEQGFQPAVISQEISKVLRHQMISNGLNDQDLMIIKDLIEVPSSSKPEQYLEISLLQSLGSNKTHVVASTPPQKEQTDLQLTTKLNEPAKLTNPKTKPQTVNVTGLDNHVWEKILAEVKKHHNTLYGVIRMAEPKFEDDKVVLAFEFAFHEKKINQANNKTAISEIIKQITGKVYEIECVLDKASSPPKISIAPKPEKSSNDELSTINNIFEGAELLES